MQIVLAKAPAHRNVTTSTNDSAGKHRFLIIEKSWLIIPWILVAWYDDVQAC